MLRSTVGVARATRRSCSRLSNAVLEIIEPRFLLAAFVTRPHGVLEVTASNAANAIHASFAAGKLTIDVDGVAKSFARAKAQEVIIHALGGDDSIVIDDSVRYTIDDGDGNDTV